MTIFTVRQVACQGQPASKLHENDAYIAWLGRQSEGSVMRGFHFGLISSPNHNSNFNLNFNLNRRPPTTRPPPRRMRVKIRLLNSWIINTLPSRMTTACIVRWFTVDAKEKIKSTAAYHDRIRHRHLFLFYPPDFSASTAVHISVQLLGFRLTEKHLTTCRAISSFSSFRSTAFPTPKL